MPTVRIGLSGWRYADWRGEFYPTDLRQRDELAYAASAFNTLEINGTFYSLQQPQAFRAWYGATPRGFRFAVKGGRFITHIRRLRDPRTPLANFFASGVLELKEKLGPVLWQLPPTSRFDPERLDTFLHILPRSTAQAAELARGHDHRLKWPAALTIDRDRPIHHALEVRHQSFIVPELVDMLRDHRVALVVSEGAGKWPVVEEMTSRIVYVRLHGSHELYRSAYTDRELEDWARKLRAWVRGATPRGAAVVPGATRSPTPAREAYVFFDNTDKRAAPNDARRFRGLLTPRRHAARS